jgi:hypothetical protein
MAGPAAVPKDATKKIAKARGGRLGHHWGGAGPAGALARYVNSNCYVSSVSSRRQSVAV